MGEDGIGEDPTSWNAEEVDEKNNYNYLEVRIDKDRRDEKETGQNTG